MDSFARVDRGYTRDAAAAGEYARIVLVAYGCIWAHLIAVALGLLQAWTLVGAAVMLSRAMTPFHEYYHTALPRYPFLVRIIPVLLSPFMGGLREQQHMHFLHHRHLGDPSRDPDHPIIHAPLPIALWYSFFQPEHALWFSLVRGRLTRGLLAEAALRALLLGAAVYVLRGRFLWYWIPARLLWAANYMAFSRMLHRTPLVLPAVARRLYIPLLLGSRWLPVFQEHPVHHRFPLVRAEHLQRFRAGALPAPLPSPPPAT